MAPCREDELDSYLDRLEGTQTLENTGFDPFWLGRHHAKVMTPYLYTGARFDTFTGNFNLRFRNYNPRHGRFLSSDPIGFLGGPNRFGYCRNNPLRWTDRWGLCHDAKLGQDYSPLLPGDSIGRYNQNPVQDIPNDLGALYNPTHLYSSDFVKSPVGQIAQTAGTAIVFEFAGLGIGAISEGSVAVSQELSIPGATNSNLKNLVNDLYKGAKGPNPIGTGNTADAIRNELLTGLPTHGKFHSQKGQEYINALSNWLKRNPNASYYDRLIAESLKRDLQSAINGN